MQFMLALIAEERSWEDVSPDEVKKNLAEMGQFNAELTEAGAMVFGAGLQERATGTTVHYGDGEPLVTDGPFAETKEQLSGFWVIDVDSLDEALAWAKKIPFTSNHVEIRPMVTGGKELLEKAEAS
ncbi:MAG TPA: YciI family protein [Solirubrobacterales bacterium]|nr:YciI family protein [Solirubrobacterales bacterium]